MFAEQTVQAFNYQNKFEKTLSTQLFMKLISLTFDLLMYICLNYEWSLLNYSSTICLSSCILILLDMNDVRKRIIKNDLSADKKSESYDIHEYAES